MERFKFMLDYSDQAIQMSNAPLTVGQKVRVIKGALTGLEGELTTIGGKTKIIVRIDMLGCAGIEMPIGFVEQI